ncbi:hypothetical protein L1049_003757 [Liquidambar formosana]|uniref:RING-type domain-containing protein n=1 Tax=Liquidambar formosana TaxID=63359 RepID=A0AAP0RM65_LIQFO
MEAGCGGGGNARRRRLADGSRDSMTGLTLGTVLGREKRQVAPPVQMSRTLLDIIRDEEPDAGPYKDLLNHHNKKSWKSFKDRIRLRRAGDAWTSSVHIPTSDVSIQNCRSQLSRRQSSRIQMVSPFSDESTRDVTQSENSSVMENFLDCDGGVCRPQFLRRNSTRVSSITADSTQSEVLPDANNTPVSDVPIQNSRSLRRNSSLIPSHAHSSQSMTRSEDSFLTREDIGAESDSVPTVRLSVALAAEREEQQRAALSNEEPSPPTPEAENGVSGVSVTEEVAVPQTEAAPPVRMSLMDLLEETDRQMGWSSYMGEAEEEEEEEEEDDNGGHEEGKGGAAAAGEVNCCVCMVRHKGAAFIPCGHTFCRLCSRELWVSRGNCPLCNGFILEILDIF